MTSGPETFVFKGKLLVLAWLLACVAIFGFLGDVVARQNPFEGGVFLVLTLAFTLLMGALILVDRSDVIVDEQAISRRLFGVIWQRMEWRNIRVIRTFHVSATGGYTAQAYNLYPKVKARFAFLPGGKMSFTDKMTNAPQFFGHLRRMASEYGINIESR